MNAPTLRQAVKALLLAPLGAVLVVAFVALFLDDDHEFWRQLATLVLLAYSLAVCYIALEVASNTGASFAAQEAA